MLDRFLSYIKEQNLFNNEDKILLAVSGGMDSMVLLHLFQKMSCQFMVAHVNHNLRGLESQDDQSFVEKYCFDHQIKCYVNKIDPIVFESGNLQDTARKIRYDWFGKIMEENQLTYMATAHHADDVLETFLINLMRGSGLDGLSSIQAKNSNIIRPLLFANKVDIQNYITKYNVPYREDSSNSTQKYLRNKVRHTIIPAMEHSDNRVKKGLMHSIRHIQSSNQLLKWFIEKERQNLCNEMANSISIKFSDLNASPYPLELLFQLIKKYGFNETQCIEMLAVDQQSGNKYISHTHVALRDRDLLIIRQINSSRHQKELSFPCSELPCIININGSQIKMEKVAFSSHINFLSSEIQYLCIDKIDKSSLVIRGLRNGDKFAPTGMNGKKQKLQDFLTNNKVPASKKEKILLLTGSGEILCVIGHRVSEFVKVSPDSKEILKIVLSNDEDYID
ncbi:MAG: tRNA lysidine(34) synthetase TilS [Saprospiraceae bacterium]|nr:tRNA lysidine(34) synthetase TilS [Saprospiraceae bacterium]